MKDILVLLVLLNAQTMKICSQPYQADSDGKCRNPRTDFLLDGSTLCCKKCNPGQRLRHTCNKTTETVCEPCPAGQYMESSNYSPNCFSCKKCKSVKGLQFVQSCSSTTRSKCGCKPGMFCAMGYDNPSCEECQKYTLCKAGAGVSKPGTPNSDVKCEPCRNGTFSDTNSYTDSCRPHTICHGRIVRQGDATSDSACEPEDLISGTQLQTSMKEPQLEIVSTVAATTMTTVSATSDLKTPRGPTDSTTFISPTVLEVVPTHSTKSPSPSTETDVKLAAVIASIVGVALLLISIIVLLCKTVGKKDAARFQSKVDANGNCENGDKINQGYLGETKLTSFKETSPEQQYLLEKAEACSNQSQSSSNTTETSTRTDGCNSYESIGPLQSTIALDDPHSALSRPMTLLSNTESVNPQTSVPTQCSSQPTSPQIINPGTTSPQVNVNIIFSIGNGSGGTLPVIPTDLVQEDSKLPFGEKEESFSIPQQEDGKQSLMSVQESASYSA